MIYLDNMDAQVRIAELEAQLVVKDARIAEPEEQVAKLTEQVATLSKQVEVLMEKLRRNSGNSHQPPSSDRPGRQRSSEKQSRRKRSSGRKRGGQPGHPGKTRKLVPEDQVNEFVHLYPEKCENCWEQLPAVEDTAAARYQVTEVPPMRPHVKELRRHAVRCPSCGYTTRAPYDESIPTSSFGPRLMSIVGLLTGVYHVSRRKTATLLSDLLGVQISLGAICAIEGRVSEALAPAVAEISAHVVHADVKHTDGTGWRNAGSRMSLWTIATKVATLFKIVANGSRATLAPLFGACRGLLVSDRAKALNFWAMQRRQICWAHLLRTFVSFSERSDRAGSVGHSLLTYTHLMFTYWHDYKDGKLDRQTLQVWMRPVRAQLEALLEKAVDADIDRMSGSCADILAHRPALWAFLEHEDVEPTNNHAERELRAFVLWRKRSFGTQSERGDRFAERIMSVIHTVRKQHKDVLDVLTMSVTAEQMNAEQSPLLGAI